MAALGRVVSLMLTVVGSLAISLVILVSPPPETEAVFVKEFGALEATFTIKMMAG